MAAVNKQSSNVVGFRYSEETSFKVADGSAVWTPLDPNSYSDFGGNLTLLARNPINQSRQRKKGVITDLEAAGGFNIDMTQSNLRDLLQGFFFADLRSPGEEAVTAVDVDGANPDEYEVAATAGFLVNSLIKGVGFAESANNAVNTVTAVVSNTSVEVADGQLVAEASPPAGAKIVVVGHVAGSADLDVSTTGDLVRIVSGGLDFTTLPLVAGQWIFVGGDAAGTKFVTAANNGWKRIRSISATELLIDKSAAAMSNETGTGLTIHLYFGHVLKNEVGSLITRRTYQLERTLGAPDDALPSQIQSEYLVGAVPSELTMNVRRADKITMDMSFVAGDNEQRSGATGVKAGTRPTLADADAFNTSSDFKRIKLAVVSNTSEAPTALFAFAQELTVTINNNLDPNKAIGTLGAFEVSEGTFEVGGSIRAYFADVAAVQAVRDNSDITIDMIIVKDNAGIVVDIPLLALGDGRLDVQLDQPITLPLTMAAASAAKISTAMDYTLMMQWFDYVPDAAAA